MCVYLCVEPASLLASSLDQPLKLDKLAPCATSDRNQPYLYGITEKLVKSIFDGTVKVDRPPLIPIVHRHGRPIRQLGICARTLAAAVEGAVVGGVLSMRQIDEGV